MISQKKMYYIFASLCLFGSLAIFSYACYSVLVDKKGTTSYDLESHLYVEKVKFLPGQILEVAPSEDVAVISSNDENETFVLDLPDCESNCAEGPFYTGKMEIYPNRQPYEVKYLYSNSGLWLEAYLSSKNIYEGNHLHVVAPKEYRIYWLLVYGDGWPVVIVVAMFICSIVSLIRGKRIKD